MLQFHFVKASEGGDIHIRNNKRVEDGWIREGKESSIVRFFGLLSPDQQPREEPTLAVAVLRLLLRPHLFLLDVTPVRLDLLVQELCAQRGLLRNHLDAVVAVVARRRRRRFVDPRERDRVLDRRRERV